MFGLFKKQESPGTIRLRQDFARVTSAVGSADAVTQVRVIHSINLANSLFHERFGSMEKFRRLTRNQKHRYVKGLMLAEAKLRYDGLPHAALGFALFKMWIWAVTAGNKDLFIRFSGGLAELSAAGER